MQNIVSSAGIIPYRIKNDKVEFFVGHPGGPYWTGEPYFAMLKGCVEVGENLVEAAKREFEEESGIKIPASKKLHCLGTIQQNSVKMVTAYAIHMDIDLSRCRSNMCEMEYPYHSGEFIECPEIDEYAWMTYDELKDHTTKSHLEFYREIERNAKSGLWDDKEVEQDDDYFDFDSRKKSYKNNRH